MLKKLILTATTLAVLINMCGCSDATTHRVYNTPAVYHADMKNPGGLMFAEDNHYEIGGEFGELKDGYWYIIELDNNSTSDNADDYIIGVSEL